MAVKRQDGETVIFSWVEWPSRATRDTGMRKAMDDPRMKMPDKDIFDSRRMIYGGFEAFVDR
jgi:uncharacterized protein YbaA (DUF1428 family)